MEAEKNYRKQIKAIIKFRAVMIVLYFLVYFLFDIGSYFSVTQPNLLLTVLFFVTPFCPIPLIIKLIKREFLDITPYYFTKKQIVIEVLLNIPLVIMFMVMLILILANKDVRAGFWLWDFLKFDRL